MYIFYPLSCSRFVFLLQYVYLAVASLRASVSKLEELVSQKDKSIRKLQKSLEEAVRNGSSIASASVVETSSSSPPPPASSSPPPPPMNTVEAEKSAQEKEQMKIILRELEARLKKSEARAKSLEDQNVSLGDEKRELESRLSSLQHGTEKNREQESRFHIFNSFIFLKKIGRSYRFSWRLIWKFGLSVYDFMNHLSSMYVF